MYKLLKNQGVTQRLQNKITRMKKWILSILVKKPSVVTFQVAQSMKNIDVLLRTRGWPCQFQDFYERKYGNVFCMVTDTNWEITYLHDRLEAHGSEGTQVQTNEVQTDLKRLTRTGYRIPDYVSICLKDIDQLLSAEGIEHKFERYWVARHSA